MYAANHRPVLGYVLRRTENPEDAADVIAETFLTAWRRLDDMPAGDQARLWLFGVARRTLANYHRGQRRRLALADRLRDDLVAHHGRAHHGPARHGNAAEAAAITGAFRSLPAADRELLALAGWEGLDPGQIAVVLGCSRNAARIRLHRARRRLADTLASGRPGPPLVPAPASTSARASATNGDLA
jgi:RNA polymerase sigma factor (sigma-70 family)